MFRTIKLKVRVKKCTSLDNASLRGLGIIMTGMFSLSDAKSEFEI